LGAGFGGGPREVRFSVLSRPILHEDWDAKRPGLWRERHPWTERYQATPKGYEQAKTDLDWFALTGEAVRGTLSRPRRPITADRRRGRSGRPSGQELFDLAVQRTRGEAASSDCYEIHYSDVTISLLTMDDQHTLDVRFPMTTEGPGQRLKDEVAYWTNHPACVRRTWVERITNPPAEGTERWFHIEFDLRVLLEAETSAEKRAAGDSAFRTLPGAGSAIRQRFVVAGSEGWPAGMAAP